MKFCAEVCVRFVVAHADILEGGKGVESRLSMLQSWLGMLSLLFFVQNLESDCGRGLRPSDHCVPSQQKL